MSATLFGVAPSGEWLRSKGRYGLCGWQVKLCDALAIGPYLSALEMRFITKRCTNRHSLLYFTWPVQLCSAVGMLKPVLSTTVTDCVSCLLLCPGRSAKYCDQSVRQSVCLSVCLSVSPRAYLWNHWTDLHKILCVDPLWTWLGLPLAASRYIMHFQFYGGCYIWP